MYHQALQEVSLPRKDHGNGQLNLYSNKDLTPWGFPLGLEGIVEWWLLERKIKRQTANVKEALAELVAKGLVLEYKGVDSQTHYRINQDKYGEIQALLKQ